ncbi:odorant receptor 74a-like [Episyrphus balteatus]|uniref:odorant receptor 74a-like n=1 Tax=Episyrphus balteatus TaxID=286459 RepID=UPI0024859242|nr:odorant receptor 74a-like [Episyrphus balteatus]
MYYKPLFPDGRQIHLPWQIKILNYMIVWPLRDNPTQFVQFFGYITVSLGLLIFLMVNEGEILFIIENFNDINKMVEALVMCIVLNECILRIFNMASTKDTFKKFLKDFFLSIYIDEKTNPKTWKQIQRGLIPTTVYSYTYILTMVSFQILPIMNFSKNRRILPYPISLHYEVEKPTLYGLTLMYLYYTGSTVTFFLIGEAYLLATFILHLNARYLILLEEIQLCSGELLKRVPKSRLASEFRKKIIYLNERNCNLDRFAGHLDKIHNFRIFVMIFFSAALLCVLSVQVASLGMSPSKNIAYLFWMIAKISELTLFGTLGSTLIQTTGRMSSAYYLSNWEEIINQSTNSKENILLMKDLQVCMSLHQNSKRLTGYKFFDVSLDTVVMVLRGAFSYYTCLHTIKQTKEH